MSDESLELRSRGTIPADPESIAELKKVWGYSRRVRWAFADVQSYASTPEADETITNTH